MRTIRRCLKGLDRFRGESKGRPLVLLLIGVLGAFILSGLSMALTVAKEEAPQIGAYGQLPLYFIKNEGQFPEKIKYYERGPGHSIFFSVEEIFFSFEKATDNPALACEGETGTRSRENVKMKDGERRSEFSVVQLSPLGIQKGIRIDGQEQQEGKANYFIGKDPGKWRKDISTYGSVVYQEAYPGIDFRFYGSNRALEYDVIIKPGANPSQVKFEYKGVQDFSITAEGDLSLQLPDGGTLTHKKPIVYQEINGKRLDVEGKFAIEPKSPQESSDNRDFVFGFEVASYHRSYPLVIDPVLVYSTYLGGSGSDAGNAIAVDGQGNAYITGKTSSTDFPTTTGLRSYAGGDSDVFVTKLNAAGTALIYSTYLGGNDTEIANGIAVDDSGYVYLTGETASDDFPTTPNAYANTPGSKSFVDAFAVKLNVNGSVAYSTYLGGSQDDVGYGIAVEKFGQAYIIGMTSSTDFPAHGTVFPPNMTALQPIFGGGYSDAFVAKLNSLGTAVVYSTFIGGNDSDAAYGIALDDNGSIYVVGETASSDFPTFGAFQDIYGGGENDVFVVKINIAFGQADYSTYVGGSTVDFGRGIAVDSNRSAYITGKTSSLDFPLANAVQTTYGGGDGDAFVTKLTPQGDSLSYSTFLGGNGNDVGYAIAVDSNRNAYVTGRTSGNFPTIKAIQNSFGGGGSDVFVSRINASSDRIDYSTYLGGGNVDYGYGITVGTVGNVYVTGKTSSLDFPTSLNAFMNLNNSNMGGSRVFVSKLNALLANFSSNRTTGTFPLTVQFTDTSEGSFSNWLWDFGDGNSSTIQNPGHTYTMPGIYSVSLSVSGSGGTDTLTRNSYITVTKPLISIKATNPVASEPGTAEKDNGLFTVSCSDTRSVPITVTYTVSGTATNGVDYKTLPGSVTIPAGSFSAPIIVSPFDDQEYEGNETVVLTITNTSGSLYDIGSPKTAVVTILDDDLPTVNITATVATVSEQGSGAGLFTVSRTGITTLPLTVNYTVVGTATNGVDYSTLTGPLTIPANAAFASITVKPIDDLEYEGNETITVILTPSSLYKVGIPNATVTIVDNDLPTVSIAATVATVSEKGPGAGLFTVSRTGITLSPLTVNYTVGGTATNDVDYKKLTGSLIIPTNSASATVLVEPIDDLEYEENETVTVTLSAAPSYILGTAKTATVTIVDNDLPTVNIAATVATVPEQGQGSAQFTVSRNGVTSSALTVNYSIAGIASAGIDYGPLTGTATISASAAVATIFITPIDDSLYEGDETVILTLLPNTSYNPGSNSAAAITIVDDDLPIVTIAATDPTAYEADRVPGHFTVYRTENTLKPLTVSYAIGGTAANGFDYNTLYGTITIPQGSSSGIITVTPADDEEYEGTETIVLTVSPSSAYRVGSPASATVSIVDNDLPAVTVVTSLPSVPESGAVKGEFKISRTGINTAALVVNYAMSGTATNGTDYVNVPAASVTIPAGSTTASVLVTPIDDTLYDGNETIILTLTGSALYNVASPNNAKTTIIDNDLPTVTVAAADPNASETDSDSNSEPGQFTITRTGITTAPLVVSYGLSGTATNGSDYSVLAGPLGSVNIPAGASSATVTVKPIDDAEYEGDETVVLTLTGNPAYQLGSPGTATVTIQDNDLPTVSIVATTPNAAEIGPVPGLLTVSRTGITTSSLTVNYTTSGTAMSGSDYIALPGSLFIPAGAPSATITLTPIDDDVLEGNETIIVNLSNSSFYNVGAPPKATVTIADDLRPIVTVVATDPSASEKGPETGQFTVYRSGSTTVPLVVGYALSGTATDGVDFAQLTSPITIPAGAASATISVTPIPDSEYEGPETVILTISPGQAYKIGGLNSTTVTIADDNRPIVTIVATNPNAAEPAVSGLFTVYRTGVTTAPLTVNYAIGGTATNAVDYIKLTGAVIVQAGLSSVGIPLQPIDDSLLEGPETVILTLLTNESYNIGSPDNATVTIADNDGPTVSVTATDTSASETGLDPAEFKISRSGNTAGAVTVYYTTLGTATNGVDYNLLPLNVVIPDGALSATIQIMPVDDSIPEDRESVMITLSSNGWYKVGSPPSATAYISDNDLPTLTIVTVDDNASETDLKKARFTVKRNSTQNNTLVVRYTTGGSATNGTDYQRLGGSLSLAPGAASADVYLTPIDDNEYQGDRTVILTLSENAFYLVGTPKDAAAVIHDNDLPKVSISALVSTVNEKGPDPGVFAVKRTGNPALPLVVNYTIGGKAVGGEDYTGLPGTLLIPAGSASADILVVAADDALIEGTETVILTLKVDPAYNIGTSGSATISILDDEWPTVTVAATDDLASEPGIDTGKFTVSRTGNTISPLTVSYTITGSAKPGTDFSTIPINVIIPANASAADIIVTPLDNKTVNPDRTVILTLSNSTSYYVGSSNQATVVIVDDEKPEVSITNIRDASEAGTVGQFRISRVGNNRSDLTVKYSIGGTAQKGVDYDLLPDNATIPAGQFFTTINMNPINDTEYEGDETVIVTLAPADSYSLGTANSVSITIADNDLPVVTIAATDPNAAEPGTDTGGFTVSRTGITSVALAVKYAIAGTAKRGIDYKSLTTTVTIPIGASSAAIKVTPIDDTEFEGDETVVITLSANAAYTVGSPNSAVVTIADNDLPSVSIAATDPVASKIILENGQFKISRSGITTSPLLVNYSIEGTATNGDDYQSILASATIPAGQATLTIDIIPIDNKETDGNETVIVTLAANAAYTIGSPVSATVKIVGRVPLTTVIIEATDASVAEGDTAAGHFTVTRSGATTSPLPVKYTLGGTANNSVDYKSLSGSLTIPAGKSSSTINVNPIDDAVANGNRTVIAALSTNAQYILGSPDNATMAIRDNDMTVSISVADAIAAKPANSGRFKINRTGTTEYQLTVKYTIGGNATNVVDYKKLSGTAVIPKGSSSVSILITPLDDNQTEPNQTVTLTLASSNFYKIGTPNKGTVTILGDNLPTVSVVATDANASEAGPKAGNFKITRTGATGSVLTIKYTLAGTAKNATDYVKLPGTATILAGSASSDVVVTPIDDTIAEASETVVLRLSDTTAYVVGSARSATVNIADND